MVRLSGSDTGAFGVLLCDAYQNTHLLWSSMSETGSVLYYQNDRMGEWSQPVDVVAIGDPAMTYLSSGIADVAGTVHVLWHDLESGGDAYYSQASLRDASSVRSWASPHLLAAGVDRAQLFVDQSGGVHVAYGESSGGAIINSIYYTHSEDDGATWSQPISIYETTSLLPSSVYPAIAVDGRGRIHIGVTLRTIDYGAHSEVGYLRSPDGGLSWDPYEVIEITGTTFQGVSTVAPYVFGDDEAHLTWHDPRRLHRWSSDGGDTWSTPVEIMPLGAAFGGPNALAMDSAGIIHAVLATADGVFSVPWDGREWGEPEAIDDRFIDPHGQHIAVCRGNQLHVVYYDRLGLVRVWYSHSQGDAPPLARQAWPTLRAIEVPPQMSPTPLGVMPTSASPEGELSVPVLITSNTERSLVVPIAVAAVSALAVTSTGILTGIRRKR